MSSSTSNFDNLLYESCPTEFLTGLLQALDRSYKVTEKNVSYPTFERPEAMDVRGHYLRGKFETEWKRLAASFPSAYVESRKNHRKTSNYTWVQFGRLFLTASSVPERGRKPRPAQFRGNYASANGQLELEMDLYERPQLEGEPVYGIFLYGPLKATLPSIATVAFPDIKWKIFLDKIDLLKRHPGFFGTNELDVEVQYEPRPEVGDLSPEEIIPEPDLPIIRRRPAEEEG